MRIPESPFSTELLAPIGEAFSCFAVEGLSHTLKNFVELEPGLRVLIEPPFNFSEMQSAVGQLTDHYRKSNFLILTKRPISSMLTKHSATEATAERGQMFWYSLLLQGVRRHAGALVLHGVVRGEKIDVHGGDLPEKFRAISGVSEPITEESLKAAYEAFQGLDYVFKRSNEHGRLRRGFKAFLAGAKEDEVDRKVHDFVRALEALVRPDKGKTEKQFIHRCQTFIGHDCATCTMCEADRNTCTTWIPNSIGKRGTVRIA
jgi:hypothetical protein